MPHDEPPFDPIAWVNELEAALKSSLRDLLETKTADDRLVDIAAAQFELGCMALERAVKGDA